MTSGGDAGFTLIEVVVAFAIVAVALGALLQIFSTGLRGLEATETRVVAARLAQSKLAAIGIEEPLEEGETTGAFDNGYRWETRISAFGDESPTQPRVSVRAYEVIVTVSWDRGLRQNAISLTTLRLATGQ